MGAWPWHHLACPALHKGAAVLLMGVVVAVSMSEGSALPPPSQVSADAPAIVVSGERERLHSADLLGLSTPGGVLMAYAAANGTAATGISLARSNDAGVTWERVTTITPPGPNVTWSCPKGTCSGQLTHSAPAIVEDALGSKNERFQIFCQTYLVEHDGSVDISYGVISRFAAPSPQGPWQSVSGLGWDSAVAFSTANVSQVLTQEPALADCVAFTTPAALVVPNLARTAPDTDTDGTLTTLLLALGCVAPVPEHTGSGSGSGSDGLLATRIVLLASTDHGYNFDLVGTLLNASDATRLNFSAPGMAAPDVVAVGVQLYLVASPSHTPLSNQTATGGYNGCLVMPLDISAKGALAVRRETNGSPVVVRHIVLQGGGDGAGGCTCWNGIDTGYLLPVESANGASRVLRAPFYAP